MFLIAFISFVLLNLIAWKEGIFTIITEIPMSNIFLKFFNDNYVCGIMCSIIAVILIYKWQVWYSKKRLKQDFRCNECIKDIYDGIKEFDKFKADIPRSEKNDKNNFSEPKEKLKHKSISYIEFYNKYYEDIYIVNMELTYEKNNLLIESIESCFFINLNFELLGILNHIKNRLYSLREEFPKIENLYKEYRENSEDDIIIKLGLDIEKYLNDVKLMASYWKELLDYLGYKPTIIEQFLYDYKEQFNEQDETNISAKVLTKQAVDIEKRLRKARLKNKIKKFLKL